MHDQRYKVWEVIKSICVTINILVALKMKKKITLGISESKSGSEFGVYHEGVWMSVQEIYKSFYE